MAEVKQTPGGDNRLLIDPLENVLVGSTNIMRYLGLRSIVTLYQWTELYGFPAVKRPDGMWMTTISAIDSWIFMAAEIDNETRPQSRGYSQSLEIAKKRLEAKLAAAGVDQRDKYSDELVKRGLPAEPGGNKKSPSSKHSKPADKSALTGAKAQTHRDYKGARA